MSSKKVFWVRFGFSNFFRLLETSEFFFFLVPLQRLISALTYVFWFITQELNGNCSNNVLKKSFLGPIRVLKFFWTTRNDRILLSSRALLETYIGSISCILVNYTRKWLEIAVSMSSKKVFLVRFGFSNFFRLLETTEFLFFLGLFKRLISA